MRKTTHEIQFWVEFPAIAIEMWKFAQLLSDEQKEKILAAVERDRKAGRENSEEGLYELAEAAKLMDAVIKATDDLLKL